MVSFYQEMQELADELLTVNDENFGQSTDTHPISIMYRTDTPGATKIDRPTVAWSTVRVKAVVGGTKRLREDQIFRDADLIVRIYAGGVTEPTLADKVDVDGTQYSILKVTLRPHGDVVSVYALALSK